MTQGYELPDVPFIKDQAEGLGFVDDALIGWRVSDLRTVGFLIPPDVPDVATYMEDPESPSGRTWARDSLEDMDWLLAGPEHFPKDRSRLLVWCNAGLKDYQLRELERTDYTTEELAGAVLVLPQKVQMFVLALLPTQENLDLLPAQTMHELIYRGLQAACQTLIQMLKEGTS